MKSMLSGRNYEAWNIYVFQDVPARKPLVAVIVSDNHILEWFRWDIVCKRQCSKWRFLDRTCRTERSASKQMYSTWDRHEQPVNEVVIHLRQEIIYFCVCIEEEGIVQSTWRQAEQPISSSATLSGVRPASYSLDTEICNRGCKAARAWSWPLTSI
jgi:hypothetical protein